MATNLYAPLVKLDEYQAIASVDAIVFVDPERRQVRLFARTGAAPWSDSRIEAAGVTDLPTLDIRIPLSEMFARD